MTVAELIGHLSALPPDMKVKILHGGMDGEFGDPAKPELWLNVTERGNPAVVIR